MKKFTPDQVLRLSQLLKLAEECGEATQMVSKFAEYGPDSYSPLDPNKESNLSLLSKEAGDILAVIDHLIDSGIIDEEILINQREKKFWLLHKKWYG